MADIPMKRCSKCGGIFPSTTEYFYRLKTGKDGLHPECKSCARNRHKELYDSDPGKARQRTKNYRAKFPEKVARAQRVYSQKYRGDNREKVREASRRSAAKVPRETRRRKQAEWREANPQKEREKQKRWRANNPERALAAKLRRRARKYALPDNFEDTDWKFAVSYFQGRCVACGKVRKLSADHWIAVADPRPDNPGTVPWNIVPMCCRKGGCNHSKGARNAEEWLLDRFGEVEAAEILARINTFFEVVHQRQQTKHDQSSPDEE